MRRQTYSFLSIVFSILTLTACAATSSQSAESRQGSRAVNDCQACYRLCEVGQDAQGGSGADQCKQDCDSKCQ